MATNNKYRKKFSAYVSIVLGCFILAFGNTVFLTPLNINAGGLNGLGIIIMNFFPSDVQMIVYNIVIYVSQAILWILSYFFISKIFAFRTLVSTIVFPLATSVFTIVPGTKDLAETITNTLLYCMGEPTTGTYMLFSLIGGVLVGLGVAITLTGGGSTGGVDVIVCMLDKYAGIKQSVGSLLVDAVVVSLGIFVLCPINASVYLIPCVVGILSIVIAAIMIDIGYVAFQTVYQADIISLEWEKVSRYAQDVLGRGATLIPIKGGYKQEDKIMVRVVCSKDQYEMLKSYIRGIDERAFITVAQTKIVLGEGFRKNK